MIYDLKSLPAEQFKIITKYNLLAAKPHDSKVVKLFYAGQGVFLCNLGECGADVLDSVAKSWKDTQALSKVRSYLKRNACEDISSNTQNLVKAN